MGIAWDIAKHSGIYIYIMICDHQTWQWNIGDFQLPRLIGGELADDQS